MLLKKIFDRYELRMNFDQHTLVGCTVRSYLTWLKNEGRIESFIEVNQLFWKSNN